MTSRQHRAPIAVAAAAAIAGGAAVALPGGGAAADGPLEFPGYGFIHAESPAAGVFTVLEACGTDGPVAVRVLDVEPVTVTGTDPDRVGFAVGWASPERLKGWGAGSLPIPPFFARDVRSGNAWDCARPASDINFTLSLHSGSKRRHRTAPP